MMTRIRVETGDQSAEKYEYYKKQVQILALYAHLDKLGQLQGTRPNLAEGKTAISVPAYFSLDKFKNNPLNEAALSLLPSYSHHPGYAGDVDIRTDRSGIQAAYYMRGTLIDAARRGQAPLFIVSDALGFTDPTAQETLKTLSRSTTFQVREMLALYGDLLHDMDEQITGDVSVVAAHMKDKGYADFFDYLMDAKQRASERVEYIFSPEGLNAFQDAA